MNYVSAFLSYPRSLNFYHSMILFDRPKKSGVLIGKWLIYRNDLEIDHVWRTIARSTFKGGLGISAKVSTAMSERKRHVICVYTGNYLDLEDVMRVRKKLRELGFTEKLCYKPDIYTYLGITTEQQVCLLVDIRIDTIETIVQ